MTLLAGPDLDAWQQDVRLAFDRVELIGELAVDPATREQLASAFRERLDLMTAEEGADRLALLSPELVALYLVATGVHGYIDGNFWDAVRRDFPSLSSKAIDRWRRSFLRTLALHGLPTFSHMHGLRFVGPILAHGGIPASCLPTFFRVLLWPAVTDARWAGMDARDLIAEWLGTPWLINAVQNPVERFLRFGGHVAEAFVGRCLALAHHEDAQGLPPHVVEAFSRFEKAEGAQRLPQGPHGSRFRRPRIVFDPRDGLVSLRLPPQDIVGAAAGREFTWVVEIDGRQQRLVTRAVREGDGATTRETSFWLAFPPVRCKVALLAGAERLRDWDWYFERRPLACYAFTVGSGELVDRPLLPAEPVWLVAPEQAHITFRRLEGESVSLSPRAEVTLGAGWIGLTGRLLPVAGWHTLHVQVDEGGKTLLVEAPDHPRVRMDGQAVAAPAIFPWPPMATVAPVPAGTGWQGWSALLEALDAWPRGVRPLPLPEEARAADGTLKLNLAGLLPSGAVGSFRLVLHDPHGRTIASLFGLTPGVSATESALGREVRVGLPPGARLEAADAVPDGVASWRVRFAEGSRRQSVRLVLPSPDARTITLEAELRAQALAWAVIGLEDRPARIDLAEVVERVGLPVLEAASHPALVVAFPKAGGGIVKAELACVKGGLILHAEAPGRAGEENGLISRARFDLDRFRDTLQTSRAGAVEMVLRWEDRAGGKGEATVLEVTQAWSPCDVSGHMTPDGQLELSWKEQVQLSERHAWLWSLWRPWEPPIKVAIPDDASGRFSWSLPAEAFPGVYRLHLDIDSLWSPREVAFPGRSAAGTADVLVGTPEARQECLARLDDGPRSRAIRFLAAATGEVLAAQETFYLEAKVTASDIEPLFLTLAMAADLPVAARKSWLGRMREIMCDYCAHDVARWLVDFRARVPDIQFEAVLDSLVEVGWLASVGPNWRPKARPVAHGQRELVVQRPLDGLTRGGLWDLWQPLGLQVEAWPLDEEAATRLERALGACASGYRPWRTGACARYQGVEHSIVRLDPDEDSASPLCALWQTRPPQGWLVTLEDGLVVRPDDDNLRWVASLPEATKEDPLRDVTKFLAWPEAVWEQVAALVGATTELASAEGITAANMDWQRTLAGDVALMRRVTSWACQWEGHFHHRLQAVVAITPALALLCQAIERRYHPVVRPQEPGLALATLPFVTGAVAMAARTVAWGLTKPEQWKLTRNDLDTLVFEARQHASMRFERDLLLIELLIGTLVATRAPR